MTQPDLLLRRARLADGRLVDVRVVAGRITAIEDSAAEPSSEIGLEPGVYDLGERLLLPGFVEAHCHLDKTLTLDRVGNASGTLMEAIEQWRDFKPRLTHEDYLARAVAGLELAALSGVTALRSHVDIGYEGGLTALEGVLEAKEKFSDLMAVQIVALGAAGVDEQESATMRDAMRAGADIVGGCPWITPDPEAAVRAVFELAETTGKPIDLHVDETEDATVNTLELIALETRARGWAGRVTVGHCCSLEFMPEARAERLMELVAEAGLHVVSLPACNLNLQGRGRHPAPRGLTRVKELLARGVNVSFASDNVRDPFHPVGDYDLLKAANLGVLAAHMSGASQMLETLEMVSRRPARALGLSEHGLRIGAWADLVVLEARSALEALCQVPPRRAVFRRGVQTVQTQFEQRFVGRDEAVAWT